MAWMAFGQGGFFFIQFFGSVILARLLSPHEMGVFAVAMATLGLFGTIQAISLNKLVVRDGESHPELLPTIFTINALLSLLLAAATAGFGWLGGLWLEDPDVGHVLVILSFYPLIAIFEFLPAAQLERVGAFRTISLLHFAQAAITLAVTILLAFRGYGALSMAYGGIAGQIVNAGATMIAGRRFIDFRLSLAHWREPARFGVHMLAISGASGIGMRLSDILLAKILGLAALGMFARASNVFNMVWNNIHMVVARVLFVDIANITRQQESLRERYLHVVSMMTGLLWPAFGGLAVLAGPFIHRVYGPKWQAAAMPLSLLCIAGAILVSITMTWEVFVARGETARQARFEFIRVGFGTTAFLIGCLTGLVGAAASRIIDALFALGLYRPHLDRMTDTRLRDYLPLYLASGVATLAAILPALGLMHHYGWNPAVPLPAALAAIVGGVLAWFLALILLDHPLYAEFRRLRPSGRGFLS